MNKYEDYIEKLVTISESIKKDKITILTGKNAGGKSLIRKVVTGDVRKTAGSKVYHASQELRTKSEPGMGALSSMSHDLEWLATSDNTLHTLEQVFRKDATYIIIDEPEIGCGEELQLGLVDFINEKIYK